jgi:hypothetical protein
MIKKKLAYLSALILGIAILLPAIASATALNQAGVRLGRLGISAASNNDLLVTFKLNTTPTSVAKIRVTFPVGFTVTTGTPTPSTSGFPNTPSITAVPNGGLTSVATAGSRDIVVSGLTSASLNNTTLYGFIIPTGTVTNPGTAGQYDVTVESLDSGNTQIDIMTTPVYIYGAGSNGDQVAVSASVAANFSFSLSANSDTIPKVDPTTIQTSTGVNMVVGTNSPLGYTAYVKSANGALTSASQPGTPIGTGTFDGTVDALTAGTTKYTFVPSTGAACSTCTGSISYDGEYNVATGSQGGAFNSTSFASFVSRNGYTNADTINLKERVTVANTIAAANDFTDTLTIVAAGNF